MATSIRLTEANEQYARHLRSQGLAENTVKNNTQVVNRAVALWGDIVLTSITHAHIDHLFSHNEWKESTRNLYLGQLNAFFKWARLHKYMPRDTSPTDGWRAIRVPKKDRTRITVLNGGPGIRLGVEALLGQLRDRQVPHTLIANSAWGHTWTSGWLPLAVAALVDGQGQK